ncbi:MAG TPA: dihydrofolate reductase family protein [Streptosporangiaceae bacterium]|nr:dihydrofolate reductase family protein [Streptosporangiaceae bacterium]
MRVSDYSLDGVVAVEDTDYFEFCRDLPDDQERLDRTRAFYEAADLHIMGRNSYEGMAGYFPTATDHPYADVMNAGRKAVFSRSLTTAGWANTVIVAGDLAEEIGKLRQDGSGYIVAHGGIGFWQSLIRLDLPDEYHLSVFPYLAGQGRRLFDVLEKSPRLELAASTPYGNGTVDLNYRRVR